MVRQSRLDEQVIQFVEQTIRQIEYTAPQARQCTRAGFGRSCTNCGASIPGAPGSAADAAPRQSVITKE